MSIPQNSILSPERIAASGSEDAHQAALFQFAALNKHIYPQLEMLFHCPNGGQRSAKEGARMKKMGVKAGYPDVGMNIARRGYHGLFIEMKKPSGGVVSDEQIKWHRLLTNEGNYVTLANHWQEARDVLIWYLTGE